MRFEKKYAITHLTKRQIEQIIKGHPAGFSLLFPDRQVNNIYFDTPDYQTLVHNMDGINQRKKYRLRWYGKNLNAISNPHLEIKIKHNELGRKEITALPSASLAELAAISEKVNQQPILGIARQALIPTLLNSYHRSYYGSADKEFRITIDWNLQFYAPLTAYTFNENPITLNGIIVELKYEAAADTRANAIFKYLPFRQTKSSKYVKGVTLVS